MIECVVCPQFSKTKNKAKYEVVLAGLDLAKAIGASSVVMYSDSQVIVGHVNGYYEAKGEQVRKYLSMVKERVKHNFLVKFLQVPRAENEQADQLAKAASAEDMAINNQVLSFIQYSPAIAEVDV